MIAVNNNLFSLGFISLLGFVFLNQLLAMYEIFKFKEFHREITVASNVLSFVSLIFLLTIYLKFYTFRPEGFFRFIASNDFFYPISMFILYILACVGIQMYYTFGSPIDLIEGIITNMLKP